MQKLVSIVLPVYNGEKYLAESIESVLNQTYKNIELIIVNDCSTDSSEEIILKYKEKDDRIIYTKNETNLKLPKSLNVGFRLASGEYYSWTSDDNAYHNDNIEKMVMFLEKNKDVGLVFCGYNVIDETGEDCGIKYEQEGSVIYNNVVGACFLYRSYIANSIGGYRDDMFLVEDYEYWLRINLKYKIAKIEEYLYDWRLHSKGLTSSSGNSRNIALGKLKWLYLKKYEDIHMPDDELIKYFNDILQFKSSLLERMWLCFLFTLKHRKYIKDIIFKLKRRVMKK